MTALLFVLGPATLVMAILVGRFLTWLGQEIAPARIDQLMELGRVDLPFATVQVHFKVQPRDREPFTWSFLRTVPRRHLERLAPGRIVSVRFNPLQAIPAPRPAHFCRPGYRRAARLWLIRGFRPWIISAAISLTFAVLLMSL